MPGRTVPLITGEYYHIVNRGSDHREIFPQSRDYGRFLETLHYYQYSGPKLSFSKFSAQKFSLWVPEPSNKLVDIVVYCLMPNHIHLLVRQLKENGISVFMSQVQNSYTKRFNKRYRRVGPLFQGAFKAIHVEGDDQLLHVSRYIHINPVVAGMVRTLKDYRWSSYLEYAGFSKGFCSKEVVLGFFSSPRLYDEFLNNQVEYGQSLEMMKHHLIDEVYDATSKVES